MQFVINDNVPAWYQLSYNIINEVPTVIFRIHRDFLTQEEPLDLNNHWRANNLKEELGLGDFTWNIQRSLGFNDSLQKNDESREFVNFALGLPQIKRNLELFAEESRAYAAVASVQLLLSWMYYREEVTSSTLPQLFVVLCGYEKSQARASMTGHYSKTLVQWLVQRQIGEDLEAVSTAMHSAWEYMYGPNSIRSGKCAAMINGIGGYFNLSVYGTHGPGLDPNGSLENDQGYAVTCHNLHTPGQILTLLVGLAALHDLFLSEVDSTSNAV